MSRTDSGKPLTASLLAACLAAAMPVAALAASSVTASPPAAYNLMPVTVTGVAQSATSPSFRIDFGDGTGSTFSTPAFSFVHSYLSGGRYTITVRDAVANVLAQTAVAITQQAGTIAISPEPSAPGTPAIVTIGVAVDPAAAPPGPVTLAFGDGTTATVPYAAQTVSHAYAAAGRYLLTLTGARGNAIARAAHAVTAPDNVLARTPLGAVVSTSLTIPAVLAGGETAIVVHYTIGDRGYVASGAPVLALVELRSPKDVLIRRSDAFELAPQPTTGLQTALIPYSVPVDAGGAYVLRVLLRAAGGGAIARSEPLPLLVAAGPDPKPSITTQFRAAGALEIGRNASGTSFDPGLTTAIQWPTHSLSLTGLYDPVSHRADPLLTLASGGPGPIASPDAQPSPAPSGAPASFKDTLGRTTASLPAILNNGTTLRGLDATRTTGDWTVHGGFGYSTLATAAHPEERATIVDVARSLGAAKVRAAFYDRDDAPRDGVVSSAGNPGAVHASVLALDVTAPLVKNVTFTATGAHVDAMSKATAAATADAAARTTLAYASGTTNAQFEYHNAGDDFAAGAGPGAAADRAGWLSSLGFNVSRRAAFSLGASRDQTRSTASTQTDAFGTFTLMMSPQSQLQLTVRRDAQASSASRTATNQLNASVNAAAFGGQLAFNASVAGLSDALNVASASTTRTATLQFARQHNAHTLAVGLTGTAVTGAAANAQTAASLTYGFPIGGRVVDGALLHGFELQFALSDSIASSPLAAGADQALSTIFSYHLTPHVAIGARAEFHHRNGTPAAGMPTAPASALRLRLDVTQ